MRQHGEQRSHRHGGFWIIAITALCVLAAAVAAFMALHQGMGRVGAQTATTQAAASHAAPEYPKVTSATDFDSDGIDDYTDIMQGARKDGDAKPRYDDGYYQGGYPPDDRGACSDTVWRAFKNAGYNLKAMVDADISANPSAYAGIITTPDPNIDFRRSRVLNVFFGRYAQPLTLDTNDHAAWQQGDIVVFNNSKHIGVISDKRDGQGNPFVIHNMNQLPRENDYFTFKNHMAVNGHYRFDASAIPRSVLRRWS